MKKLKDLKAEYDTVVIGGGLGGLTCANRLAQFGHSVLLVEQHKKLGGLATWFKRKKHIFDVSLHGFPAGMVKTVRKYWSKEISNRIIPLKGIRFDNPQFNLTTTYDRKDFITLLVEKFQVDHELVLKFFEHTKNMKFFDNDQQSTGELLRDFFGDRNDIVRLLMEPITYANGSTLDDPAISYGIVFSNFMDKGVFTFKGGTDLFIKLLESELIKNSVDIRVNALAEEIILDKDSKVAGIKINGQIIKTKSVVSNANLKTTLLEMVDSSKFSPTFLTKIKNVRINSSSCQVYIGLKKDVELDYMGDLIFKSTAPQYSSDLMLAKKITSRTYSIYYPTLRDNYHLTSIVASSNARYEDWVNLSKDEYKQEKKELAADTLEDLAGYIPDIEKLVDYVEVATPRTFERYTLHQGGSSFGTKFEGLEISRNLSSELGGLFHTGSVAIIMSGWLGAANYGVIVANDVDKYLS
ncbi:MAG: phytoene desaturase family protein [Nitrospinota bacterium]